MIEQIKEFFSGLFTTALWPARWHCGTWSDFHGWLYIVSDLLIWLSYFLIPILIIDYFKKKNGTLKFNNTYIYFAAFILLCGTTHFTDAMMFWVPMYRLNALLKLATAIVSLLTVYHLFKILPDVFSQKTSIELEQEINRRVAAEHRLEDANKRLEGFASVASHDLQEPLRKISRYVEQLKESNNVTFDPSTLQQIDKISDATARMKSLIANILTLSSIKQKINLTTVDPKLSLEQAINDLEIKIADKQAVINYSALPLILGNDIYLTQLFLNLLSNALKFNSNKPVINIIGKKKGDFVIISISDNGIGINAEHLPKIFEAFRRLHSKSSYEGTGIGLTICKNIVDSHQGSITVSSIPEEGTTFELTFLASH